MGFTAQKSAMANTTFLLDALVASPAETLAWLKVCCAHSCDLVATDVSSAVATVNLAHNLGIKQCRALAHTEAKAIAAARESCRNVAAGLDAIASLCASAMSAQDVQGIKPALEEGRRGRQLVLALQPVKHRCWLAGLDADAGGRELKLEGISVGVGAGPDDAVALDVYFKQWVDVPTLDGYQFVCVVDKGKDPACWPRGQHSFTLHVNVMAVDSTLVAVLRLPPEAAAVAMHGDDTATWTCAQHPDGFGIEITYTAAAQAAEVEIAVYALGAAVFYRRLVSACEVRVCMHARAQFICFGRRVGIWQVRRDRHF